MMKRLFATFFAFILFLSIFSSSWAETEITKHSFTAILAPEMDSLATAGEAVKSSNRASSSAILYFEYILYQQLNDLDLEDRALWNDCLIGRSDNLISVIFDLGEDTILLLVHDTLNADTSVAEMEATMYAARKSMEDNGFSVYSVSGEDWSDYFQLIIRSLGDLE